MTYEGLFVGFLVHQTFLTPPLYFRPPVKRDEFLSCNFIFACKLSPKIKLQADRRKVEK
jgi:hypothetical protein